ncbi:hypothetical protein Pmani_032134, partial [Petrolisthes manimaculis]
TVVVTEDPMSDIRHLLPEANFCQQLRLQCHGPVWCDGLPPLQVPSPGRSVRSVRIR